MEHNDIIGAAIGAGVLAVEAWLGKTDKVKSGSLLELVFNIVISIFKKRNG